MCNPQLFGISATDTCKYTKIWNFEAFNNETIGSTLLIGAYCKEIITEIINQLFQYSDSIYDSLMYNIQNLSYLIY